MEFRSQARVTLSRPLVSLLPCARAPIFPVAVACTRTERSTQTVRDILFRFEHWDLEPKPTHLGHDPNRFFFTIQTLRDSTVHSTLPYSTSSPLDVSQPAVSLVNFRNRLGALLHMPRSLCSHALYCFSCRSKPSLVTPPSRTT